MKPFYALQTAFVGGEISPEVANRVDLDKYQFALLKAKNCYIRPYGPVYRRGGTVYCSQTKYPDRRCILVPFNYTQDINYLLEFGHLYVRIHRNGTDINEERETPFTEDELGNLRFAQSADVLTIVSGTHPVMELSRYSETDWRLERVSFDCIYFDESLQGNAVAGMRYDTAGSYSFTAPTTGEYKVTIAGAGGGGGGAGRSAYQRLNNKDTWVTVHASGKGGDGGRGALVEQTVILTAGQSYLLTVGEGGSPGADVLTNGTLAIGNDGGNGTASAFNGTTALGGGGGKGGRALGDTDSDIRYTIDGASGTSAGNGSEGGLGSLAYSTTGNGWVDSFNNKGKPSERTATKGADGVVTIEYLGNITITPSAKDGEVVLTASNPVFIEGDVGSQIKLIHEVPASEAAVSNGTSTPVYAGEGWKVISHGTWTGSFEVQRSKDNDSWTTYRKYTSKNDFNPTESGSVSVGCYLRVVCNITSGTCNVDLTAMPYTHEGYAVITGYVSSTKVNALVKKSFGSTEPAEQYCFGAWSEAHGYPRTVCYFQDRLCFGGSKRQPYTVWMSKTGDYYNFDVKKVSGKVTDDSAVAAGFISRRQHAIRHMIPASDLLVLTEGNEWLVSGASTVTPSSINPRMQTTRGSNDCEPIVVGNKIVFVQARGASVREIGYTFETDSYSGNDLTLLVEHLIRGKDIVDITYKQEPNSMVYCVRSDGVVLYLSYIAEQNVYAWTTIESDGKIEAVCTVTEGNEDLVYCSVLRDGKRYIEYFSNDVYSQKASDYIMVDCAVQHEFEEERDDFSVPHLAGRSITVLGDGRCFTDVAVDTEGNFHLPTMVKKMTAGIPYSTEIQVPPMESNPGDGTMQGRKKAVNSAVLRLRDSLGGYVGADFKVMDYIKYDELNELGEPVTFNGDKRVNIPLGGFNDEGCVCIHIDEPYPFMLMSIVREVSFGG